MPEKGGARHNGHRNINSCTPLALHPCARISTLPSEITDRRGVRLAAAFEDPEPNNATSWIRPILQRRDEEARDGTASRPIRSFSRARARHVDSQGRWPEAQSGGPLEPLQCDDGDSSSFIPSLELTSGPSG